MGQKGTFLENRADSCYSLQLLRATLADSHDIWQWRNDPHSRAMSKQSEPICFATHHEWYQQALARMDCYLYIGKINGQNIGMCRFEVDDHAWQASISINLNPDFRAQGLAPALLEAALAAFRQHSHYPVIATIKRVNTASICTFKRLGFICLTPQGEDADDYYLPAPV